MSVRQAAPRLTGVPSPLPLSRPRAPPSGRGSPLALTLLGASLALNVVLLGSRAAPGGCVHVVPVAAPETTQTRSLSTPAEDRVAAVAPPAEPVDVLGRSRAPAAGSLSDCHRTIKSRNGLPEYLNDLGLVGEGVEVGVRRGFYSKWMLAHWRGRVLHLVDPWEFQASVAAASTGGKYQDRSNAPDAEHEDNLAYVRRELARFDGRFEIHRAYSVAAARTFADASLDFVYVDARHDYEGCLEDLRAWYPKLRPGGVISGHDYIPDGTKREGVFGVQRAASEFALEVSREVQSISTKTRAGGRAEPQRVDAGWTTFYWIK